MVHVYIEYTISRLRKASLTTHHASTPVIDAGNNAVLPHSSALRLNTVLPYSSSGSRCKSPANAVLGPI